MAKGQKRSGREPKKAKQNKPKAPVTGSPTVSVLQTKPTAPASDRKK
jgi:hypothetical protein